MGQALAGRREAANGLKARNSPVPSGQQLFATATLKSALANPFFTARFIRRDAPESESVKTFGQPQNPRGITCGIAVKPFGNS
jgi:hypothetical protein